MLSLMLSRRCARTSFILMCTFPSCPSCIVEEGRSDLWRTPQTRRCGRHRSAFCLPKTKTHGALFTRHAGSKLKTRPIRHVCLVCLFCRN
uniref:Putative secreted protein n=1 Tax=Ixodes ricinus TaxID=34613 RepID=A0A6B0UAN2_IXORI